MSKGLYDVIGGVTHKVKKQYLVLDGVTRKIKKSYHVVDGVARCFYSGDPVVYTGAYTVSTVTDTSGNERTLYTLTGSGTLTILADVESAELWMCGGGGCGARGDYFSSGYSSAGGGGGGGYVTSGNLSPGVYTIAIGAGAAYKAASNSEQASSTTVQGGSTAYEAKGGYLANSTYALSSTWTGRGGNGASGGGGGMRWMKDGTSVNSGDAGVGDKSNTYPFQIETLSAHCAGGGGGAIHAIGASYYPDSQGGDGGSCGSNGKTGKYLANLTTSTGGAGGVKGGGKGGNATNTGGCTVGSGATFYGSGGGGGSYVLYKQSGSDSTYTNWKKGGAGYQGVVYLLI